MTLCPVCAEEITQNTVTCPKCENDIADEVIRRRQLPRSEQIVLEAQLIAVRVNETKAFAKREIAELPQILAEDEELLDLTVGFYQNGTGVLAATDRRFIFINRGLVFGLKVEDFPIEKVSSIQYETGLLLGAITIITSGNKARISNVQKDRARAFAESARARQTRPQPANNARPNDPLDDLERLAALRDKGILTTEEFAEKKKQILGVVGTIREM